MKYILFIILVDGTMIQEGEKFDSARECGEAILSHVGKHDVVCRAVSPLPSKRPIRKGK